jgi:uncharacterized protein YbjT (DUF2867 family)
VSEPLTLVTGASGYVGGRLVSELERRGQRVRCLARRPDHVRPRVGEGTEVVAGDVLDPASLPAAMAGVDSAYYLVHSMASRADFEEADRQAAANFASAARAAGVGRMVYLGGLGREPGLSRHLRSRHEVGRVLRESGVPTIELRASIVIGSGSLSFEMVRALVERLPVMITPRWVGVGVRRGRRDPDQLRPGDTLDFWRVEAVVPDALLRLRAEMRLPGRAWLQFELEPEAGGTRLRQVAIFEPRGLAGLAYWYALYPAHQLVFAGMLRGIAAAVGQEDAAAGGRVPGPPPAPS